jgi:hypothetical protein
MISWLLQRRVLTRSAPAWDALRGACTTSSVVGGLQAVLGHWAGGGLRLPQAKSPLTVARCVIHIGPEPCQWGSGSFVLRGGGGSRKLAAALLGVHTPRKIRARFQECKHTSLNLIVVELSAVRLYSAQKTILVTVVVTLGRQ